jgi:hypothetical protein
MEASTSQRVPEGKVLLISADDFQFLIDEDAAKVSTTLRGMLDSQGVFDWNAFVESNQAGLWRFA